MFIRRLGPATVVWQKILKSVSPPSATSKILSGTAEASSKM